MIDFFKKYWDIICGMVISTVLAFLAKFQLYEIQLCYSIIVLVLVSIGFFRIIKQAIDNSRSRNKTIIDEVIDRQTSFKAVRLAQEPTKDGEVLGEMTIKLWEGVKRIMKSLKVFFDKFKGIMLAIALGVLSFVEGNGGYINEMFGGVLIVNGVEIIPLITQVASLIVGIISNCWTKEQKAQIRELFKSSKVELVTTESEKSGSNTSEKIEELKNL